MAPESALQKSVEELPNLVRLFSSTGRVIVRSRGWVRLLVDQGIKEPLPGILQETPQYYPLNSNEEKQILETCQQLQDGSWMATANVVPCVEFTAKELERNQKYMQLAQVGGWQLLFGETPKIFWTDVTRQIHEVDDDYTPQLDTALAFYTPEAQDLIRERVERGMQTGEGWKEVVQFTTAKNRNIWVETIGIPEFESDTLKGLSGIFRDVTLQKETMDALAVMKERFELATRPQHTGVWDFDCKANTLVWDESMHQIYGYSPEEFTGEYSDWRRCVHPEDIEETEKAFQEALDNGHEFNCEFKIVCKDGKEKYIKALATILHSTDGTPVRAVGINCDITNLHETHEELREAKEAAEAASKAKDEFLANISHEIRTPLLAISGYAEQISEEVEPDSRVGGYIRTIMDNGSHLNHLINDLLDLAKLSATKLSLDCKPVPVPHLVKGVAELFQANARQQGITLDYSINFPLPSHLILDPTRVRQVLSNLVSNAIKFTPRGTVSIAASYDADTARLQIKVKDSGIGIKEEFLEHIFGMFNQVKTHLHKKTPGTGLGLSICRELVELMGGTISAKSKLNEGTTFSLTIPAEPAPDAIEVSFFESHHSGSGSEHKQISKKATRKKQRLSGNILLVEDGCDNRRLIELLLSNAGAAVTAVSNGAQALESARSRNFDLILMDMQMPVMDGFQATEQIRNLDIQTPIIATTGVTLERLLRQCRAVGCNEVLHKPFRRSKLIEICAKHMGVTVDRQPVVDGDESEAVDMSDLVEKFKQLFHERYNLLCAAFEAKDIELAIKMSHRLRNSGMFGFDEIGELAGKIEDNLRVEPDWETATTTLADIGRLKPQI